MFKFNKKAEGSVDTAVKLAISVILGGAILFSMTALVNNSVVPGMTQIFESEHNNSAAITGDAVAAELSDSFDEHNEDASAHESLFNEKADKSALLTKADKSELLTKANVSDLNDKVDVSVVTVLQNDVDTLKTRVGNTNVSADIATINSNITSINSSLNTVNSNITTINNNITSLTSDLNVVKENFDEIKDYIIEKGTSGVWTYEKYKSGKVNLTANFYYSVKIPNTEDSYIVNGNTTTTWVVKDALKSVTVLSGNTATYSANNNGGRRFGLPLKLNFPSGIKLNSNNIGVTVFAASEENLTHHAMQITLGQVSQSDTSKCSIANIDFKTATQVSNTDIGGILTVNITGVLAS